MVKLSTNISHANGILGNCVIYFPAIEMSGQDHQVMPTAFLLNSQLEILFPEFLLTPLTNFDASSSKPLPNALFHTVPSTTQYFLPGF